MTSSRFIWKRLQDQRACFIAALLLAAVEGGATAMLPFCVANAMVTLLAEPESTAFMVWTLLAPASVIVRVVALRWSWTLSFQSGNAFTERVRNELVEHMRKVSMGIIQSWGQARLAALISEDGRWVNEVSTFTLARVTAALTTTVALAVIVACYSKILALGVVISLIIAAAWMPLSSRLLAHLIEQRSVGLSEATRRIGEFAQGIAVFRTFGVAGMAFERLRLAVDALHVLMSRHAPAQVALAQLGAAAVALSLPLGLLLLAYFHSGPMNPEQAQGLIPALFMVLSLRNVLTHGALKPVVVLALASRALLNIRAFLAEPVLQGSACRFDGPLDVCFKDVTFSYSTKHDPALRNLSFTARAGEMTALVGPSGSGKSTIAQLVLRYFDCGQGKIQVAGLDIANADPRALQRLISYVSQDIHILDDSLRANILLGNPQATVTELEHAIRAGGLSDVVHGMNEGLDTRVGAGGRNLSGGERQRVAIARAFLKKAPILIFDEATSAMDPLTEHAISRAIMRLKGHCTILVIAHRLSTIADAEHIVVLDGGQVTERGNHDQLIAMSATYQHLWDIQRRTAGWKLQ